jgi:small subunit ribosomal protein S20
MPVVHKSTIKRARQAEKRQQRNRQILSAVKTAVKKVLTAVDQTPPDAHALLREATSALHKATAKGVIKRNTASRRVSRLAAKINALASRT